MHTVRYTVCKYRYKIMTFSVLRHTLENKDKNLAPRCPNSSPCPEEEGGGCQIPGAENQRYYYVPYLNNIFFFYQTIYHLHIYITHGIIYTS
jgi:hypothetical protein